MQVLADQGGINLQDFIKRVMKFLMAPTLARAFNLTGQGRNRNGHMKSAFKDLQLFEVLCGMLTYIEIS